MHAEELAIDLGCDRESIEEFHEVFVNLSVIVLDALMSEVEIAGAFSCFMVTAQKYYIMRLLYLHGGQIGNNFRTIHSTIDIVTHEDKLIHSTRVSADLFKHIEQVI